MSMQGPPENRTQNSNPSSTGSSSSTGSVNEASNEQNAAPGQYGCKHYVRRCVFVSPCCGKIYPCRLCHDERESHKMNRHDVKEIVCMVCSAKQAVSRCCSSCGVEFGKYFCEICRLYDDNTEKRQFHCDGCGHCRLHGRQNYFHCSTCNMCYHTDMKKNHKCIENVGNSKCMICLEDLHNSTESIRVLECNHMTHRRCFKALLRTKNYTCPICCRTMIDRRDVWRRMDEEIAQTPMPPRYTNPVRIICRDCQQFSEIQWHVVGLKCQLCGSYNTTREATSR